MTSSSAFADLDTTAAGLLSRLEALRAAPPTPETLPAWLGTCSRVKCEVQTLWGRHILPRELDTNDAEVKARYDRLMQFWIPQIEAHDEPLARLALDAGAAEQFPGIARKLRADLHGQQTETMRALLSRERLLANEHSTVTANQTVKLDGETVEVRAAEERLAVAQTSQERQAIWEALKDSNLAAARELDGVFAELLDVRQRLAAEAGRANYAEHVWAQTNREYSIPQMMTLLDDLAEVFAPLTALVDKRRAQALGVSPLRPWDLGARINAVTSYPLPVEDFIPTVRQIVNQLDPEFGPVVDRLNAENAFDLTPRPGKIRGNFALLLSAEATARVVCNVSDGLNQFGTLLHELGHAIHFMAFSGEASNTIWDISDFQDICEFYAFVFANLGTQETLRAFEVSPEDAQRLRRSRAEGFLARLRHVDERVRFELWVYQQPGAVSTEALDTYFRSLYHRPGVDWTGHEDLLGKGWQNQFLFHYSFYNIEYSIATIAALLFTRDYEANPAAAMTRLKSAMRMGATAGSTAIFAEAGITFPFTRQQLETARDVLAEWLA